MPTSNVSEKKSISFILGCPMFLVIFGIITEIIVAIHFGVLYGLWACSFAALIVSFLNYFHNLMNLKCLGPGWRYLRHPVG